MSVPAELLGINNPFPRLIPSQQDIAAALAPMNFDMDDPRWTFNAAVNQALASGVSPQELVGGQAGPIPLQGFGFDTTVNPSQLHPSIAGVLGGDPLAFTPEDFRTLGDFERARTEAALRASRTRAALAAAAAAGGAALAGGVGGGAAAGTELAPVALPDIAAIAPSTVAAGGATSALPLLPSAVGSAAAIPEFAFGGAGGLGITGANAAGASALGQGLSQIALPDVASIAPGTVAAGGATGLPTPPTGTPQSISTGGAGFLDQLRQFAQNNPGALAGLGLGAAGLAAAGTDLPSPPPAPDPMALINAAAQANRIDQVTPFGSLRFSGPNRSTATLELDPGFQQILDRRLESDRAVLDQALGRVNNLPQPFDLGSLPNVPTLQTPFAAAPNAPDLVRSVATPDLQRNLNLQTSLPGVNLQRNVDLQNQVPGVDLQTNIDLANALSRPELQRSIPGLDLSGATPLPETAQAFRGDVERAFFDRSAGLLSEQFGRDEERLRQTLANQGLQSGGEAFGTEFGLFNQRRGETFENLARDAVLFGGQEASRQLADILALRGQGVNEALSEFGAGLTQGQFANQAANQGFANELTGLTFENQSLLDEALFGNQAQLGQLNADLAQGTFANQAALSEGNFANQAALQQFGTDLQRGQFSNEALLAEAQFGNQAALDQLMANISSGQFANQASGQQFGIDQAIRDANLQNQLLANDTRSQQFALGTQGLQNELAGRGAQLGEIASLMGLQQADIPDLGNFFGPSAVNTTDAFALQQGALQNAFNANTQAQQAKKGGAADLAGTLGGALISSDRRLKDSAVKIGEYRDNNVYLFWWNDLAEPMGLEGPAIGVMADEVDPKYVTRKDGYLAVDYGALHASQ